MYAGPSATTPRPCAATARSSNITVQFAPFVSGIAIAMEVARVNRAEASKRRQAALMGPLSGIGDSIFLSTLRGRHCSGISLCQAAW